MTRAEQAIRKEIAEKQSALDALRKALAVLTSAGSGGRATVRPRGKRPPKTAAEKAALSKAMRAAWRRRKAQAASGAKGGKRPKKTNAAPAS